MGAAVPESESTPHIVVELSGTAALLLQHLFRDPAVAGAAVTESEPTLHIIKLPGTAALLPQHLHGDPVSIGAAIPESEPTPPPHCGALRDSRVVTTASL